MFCLLIRSQNTQLVFKLLFPLQTWFKGFGFKGVTFRYFRDENFIPNAECEKRVKKITPPEVEKPKLEGVKSNEDLELVWAYQKLVQTNKGNFIIR